MFVSEILIEQLRSYDIRILDQLKKNEISEILAIEYSEKISNVFMDLYEIFID